MKIGIIASAFAAACLVGVSAAPAVAQTGGDKGKTTAGQHTTDSGKGGPRYAKKGSKGK